MSSANVKAPATDDLEGIDSSLARVVFAGVIVAARDAGCAYGREIAYSDILDELRTALNEAEQGLQRAPKSELMMAEVMAAKRLIAIFEDAPAHFKEKGDEHARLVNLFCERIGAGKLMEIKPPTKATKRSG
jgi:hypothetical protein